MTSKSKTTYVALEEEVKIPPFRYAISDKASDVGARIEDSRELKILKTLAAFFRGDAADKKIAKLCAKNLLFKLLLVSCDSEKAVSLMESGHEPGEELKAFKIKIDAKDSNLGFYVNRHLYSIDFPNRTKSFLGMEIEDIGIVIDTKSLFKKGGIKKDILKKVTTRLLDILSDSEVRADLSEAKNFRELEEEYAIDIVSLRKLSATAETKKVGFVEKTRPDFVAIHLFLKEVAINILMNAKEHPASLASLQICVNPRKIPALFEQLVDIARQDLSPKEANLQIIALISQDVAMQFNSPRGREEIKMRDALPGLGVKYDYVESLLRNIDPVRAKKEEEAKGGAMAGAGSAAGVRKEAIGRVNKKRELAQEDKSLSHSPAPTSAMKRQRGEGRV